MVKATRRGFDPNDARNFSAPSLRMLHIAAEELHWLLNHSYPIKSATTFIGNHYQFSSRQRMALVRAVSGARDIRTRQSKRLQEKDLENHEIHIDGFNTIITLEVALSGVPVLRCMDGAIRDLAGLRGNYRIIDKTPQAVRLILDALDDLCVASAHFYLDAPVSNSGRLRALIDSMAHTSKPHIKVDVIHRVDQTLMSKAHVITSDAIILDACQSWFNLNAGIIKTLQDVYILSFIPNAP